MKLYFETIFKEFKEKLNITDEKNEILESLLSSLIIDVKELDYSENKNTILTKSKSMFENIDWEKQQKGVKSVMDNLQNWDTSKKTSFENLGKNNLK